MADSFILLNFASCVGRGENVQFYVLSAAAAQFQAARSRLSAESRVGSGGQGW